MAAGTRGKLLEATIATLSEVGIAGTSARAIGGRAGVNPALIYYHFEDLGGLLAEASRLVTQQRAETYRERLVAVASLTELAAAARSLHAEEHANGNLAMLGQLLAGTRTHPGLAPVLDQNFGLLADAVAETLERLLTGTALEGLLDPQALARTVSAGFIGIELLDSVAPEDGIDPFEALDSLAVLIDAVLDAGAIPTGLLRRRLRSVAGRSASPARR